MVQINGRNQKSRSILGVDISELGGIALYGRTSSDEQEERGTIKTQIAFAEQWAALYKTPIVDTYLDDGWSGTIPLHERPEGKRLLEDAAIGKVKTVVFYKLDRIGRSLKVILDVYEKFTEYGVTIQSLTEPIDTSNAIGRFLFQLLGSLAELERANIQDRTIDGRNRVLSEGKFVTGPVPYGYRVDASRRLVPSTVVVESVGLTEAQILVRIFELINQGNSMIMVADWLNANNIPPTCVYLSGKQRKNSRAWYVTRLCHMLHRTTYYTGQYITKTARGPIVAEIEPLVDSELWHHVQDQLLRNRKRSTKNVKNNYLLSGLIRCHCGYGLSAFTDNRRGCSYYTCTTSSHYKSMPHAVKKCHTPRLRADMLEGKVWGKIREYIENPDHLIDEARKKIQERNAKGVGYEVERAQLLRQIAEKDQERQRVKELCRRGRISIDEADADLETINRERAQLQQMVESMKTHDELTRALEHHTLRTAEILRDVHANRDAIESDFNLKRQLVDLLVSKIELIALEPMVPGDPQGNRRRIQIAVDLVLPGEPLILNAVGESSNRPSTENTLVVRLSFSPQ